MIKQEEKTIYDASVVSEVYNLTKKLDLTEEEREKIGDNRGQIPIITFIEKSPREERRQRAILIKQIQALMAQGKNNEEIAEATLLSEKTVSFYKHILYKNLKINTKDRAACALRAVLCYFYRSKSWDECREKIRICANKKQHNKV